MTSTHQFSDEKGSYAVAVDPSENIVVRALTLGIRNGQFDLVLVVLVHGCRRLRFGHPGEIHPFHPR
jgi:hypothetical protein